MNVMARAKPGFEAEFDKILADLSAPSPASALSLWDRLRGKTAPPPPDRDALVARFQDISDAPYTLMGAPICGQDPQADAWLEEQYQANAFVEGKSLAEVKSDLAGYHVLSLLRPSDGLPVYSNGGMGYDVDETSFRGAFLNDCTFLEDDDLMEAWGIMTPQQFSAFGTMLRKRAYAYAEAEGVLAVLDRYEPPEDSDSPASRAHIAISCAKWATFWGARGHGMEPYF